MHEFTRKSLYVIAVAVVFCACALSLGRAITMFPERLQTFINTELSDRGIELEGLQTSWRLVNPIFKATRVTFPTSEVLGVEIEISTIESLVRSQFVARRLLIEELNLEIEIGSQLAEFDLLQLITQIQSNFEWVRHTDELQMAASVIIRRNTTHQHWSARVQAVNLGGIHRYRAAVWNMDKDQGGKAEFVADAVDTLLDLRTGDYQMTLNVENLPLDAALLVGKPDLPNLHLTGSAVWEMVNDQVQGHLDAELVQSNAGSLVATAEVEFLQQGDEPARFKVKRPTITIGKREVLLSDWLLAFDTDTAFGSTHNLPLHELVPVAAEILKQHDTRVRWLNETALHGTLEQLAFAVDAQGLHWYADAHDLSINDYQGIPAIQLLNSSIFGNLRQIAFAFRNSPSQLFLRSHFDRPWDFASATGLMMLDVRDSVFSMHLLDIELHIAPEAGQLNPTSHLDVATMLQRDNETIHINELIHEPITAKVQGGMSHVLGGEPTYQIAFAIESQNTLLPAHQAPAFVPSNLLDHITSWREQYLESASFFGTRVAYLTFRDAIFPQNELELQVDGHFAGATVHYQPNWPPLRNVGGSWFADTTKFVVTTDRATVQNTELTNGIATFSLDSNDSFLVTFNTTAKTQALLDFVQASELKDWLPAVHKSWHGEGLVTLNAALKFPYQAWLEETAPGNAPVEEHHVDFQFHDASIAMPDLHIEFHELNGLATWQSPYHVEANVSRGTFFDKPMTGSIQTKQDGDLTRIEFELDSRIDIDRAMTIAHMPDVTIGKGITEFNATLYLYPDTDTPTALFVSSDFDGVTFDLPTAITSYPATANASGLQITFHDDRTELTLQSQDINGWVTWDDNSQAILEGAVALGHHTTMPSRIDNRLHISGDLDSWQYELDDTDQFDVPIVLSDVRIAQLTAFDASFTDVWLNGSYADDSYDIEIQSDEFTGSLTKRIGEERMSIQASTVKWSLTSDESTEDLLSVAFMDQVVPIEVSIDELFVRTDNEPFQPWGAWKFAISPIATGIEISKLSAETRGLRIETTAPLKWIRDTNETTFKGRVYGNDLRAILEAWEFDASIESETFEVHAELQWPGSPLAIDLKRASGRLQANANDGRFIDVNQGGDVLRLISLLNFSKVINRLAFDFSDVTQSGLHYDTASLDINLANGIFTFNEPLRVAGPSARLRLDGEVNTQSGEVQGDLTVRIPLHKGIQTYAAYLAATNPPATVALLLGTLLVSEPIKALLTANYKITGNLNDPILTRESLTPTRAPQTSAN